MRVPTATAAHNRWPGILRALGASDQLLSGNHGPCPECGGDDRFRFDDRDGRGTWFCTTCDPQSGDGLDLVQKILGCNFRQAAKEVDQILGNGQIAETPAPPKPDPRPRLRKVASLMKPAPMGQAVWVYLDSRGLPITLATRQIDSMPYYENGRHLGDFPAMAHYVCDKDGKEATIHLTYLRHDGMGKAGVKCPKKLLPPIGPWQGGAIRLYGEPGPILGVAEGVETAIAASMIHNVPVWATVSSGNLEQFEVPEGVEELIVFGDNDNSFTGQAAAYALAKRWTLHPKRPIQVDVYLPPNRGYDWNDQLRA